MALLVFPERQWEIILNVNLNRWEKMDKDRPRKKELVQRYWEFVRPYRFIILLIIFLGIMSFAVTITTPWFTKQLIDDVLSGKEGFWYLTNVVVILGICV